MRHLFTIVGTLLIFAGLQAMLWGQLLYEHKSVTLEFSRDIAVFLTLTLVLARLGWRRGNAFIFGLCTLSVVVFEYARSIGAVAMGQDPLLYDAVLLVSHMFVLFRDMLGEVFDALFWKFAAALSLSVVFVFSGLVWVAARARNSGWLTLLVSVSAIWGMVFYTTLEESPYPSKFSTPALVDNTRSSFKLWWQLREGIGGDAYAPLETIALSKTPDVHIYIVESYGVIMNRKLIRDAWQTQLKGMQETFATAGWHMMSGSSAAPVSGGRSWLADATVLSGIRVEYESVYRHLMPQVGDSPSMVNFLRNQGYRSLLVRPKDMARPGVELVNHFGFDSTVFFLDLEYEGIAYGWSGIPDQFTLGRIASDFIPALGDAPRFVFFHMATSHLPWNELPPVVEDWRELGHIGAAKKKNKKQKNAKKEIKIQLKRFQRKKTNRVNRLRAKSQNLEKYAAAIAYDLDVLTRHIMEFPTDREAIVILMGDHQPPMIGRSKDFKVPVHVLATDPALLKEFKKRGFSKGMTVDARNRGVRHEAIFSILTRALTKADGQAPPAFLPHGAVELDAVAAPVAEKKGQEDIIEPLERFDWGGE